MANVEGTDATNISIFTWKEGAPGAKFKEKKGVSASCSKKGWQKKWLGVVETKHSIDTEEFSP